MASNKKEKEQVQNFYSKKSDILKMIKENQEDFGKRFYEAFGYKYLDIDEQTDIIRKYDEAINQQLEIEMNDKNIQKCLEIVGNAIGRKANTDDLLKIVNDQKQYGFKNLVSES